MRLFLHIGAAKCGSTTIQDLIRDNAAALGRRGVVPLRSAGFPNAWKLSVAAGSAEARRYWVADRKALSPTAFDALPERLWPALADEVAGLDAPAALASSEFIYGRCARDAAAIARLRDGLGAIFDRVTVLFYCRDQVELAKSFYAQRLKGPLRITESYDAFLGDFSAHDALLDFDATLGLWADAFGAENLRVRAVDGGGLHRGDLIGDVLDALGLDAAALDARPARSNATPGYTALRLLRAVNRARRAGRMPLWLGATLRRALTRPPLARLGPTAFPRHLDAAIAARYRASNAALAARFPGAAPDWAASADVTGPGPRRPSAAAR